MHVDIVDDFKILSGLRRNWDAVFEADPDAHFYLSWRWVSAWFERLDCQWLVLALRPGEEGPYAGFMPLQLRTVAREDGYLYNELCASGIPLAPLEGFLCDPQFLAPGTAAFADSLLKLNWAALRLHRMGMAQSRLDLLLDCMRQPDLRISPVTLTEKNETTDYSIYPYVPLPADMDSYIRAHLSPRNQQYARSYLKLIDNGSFTVTHAADESSFERDLDVLLSMWQARWALSKGELIARIEANNHRNMLRACFSDGTVLLATLWKEGAPLAGLACLIDRKRNKLLGLISARDMNFRRPSPIFMLRVHTFRWAIAQGFAEYDAQQGNHPYKYDFGPQERYVPSFVVATEDGLNRGGRLEPRSIPVAMERVEEQLGEGRLEAAEKACLQILTAKPGDARALTLLSDARRKTPSMKNPAVRDAAFKKAFELHQRGDTAGAEAIYRAILKDAPEHFDASHLLGVILLDRGENLAAEQQIADALAINPGFAAAHNNRGNALKALARVEEALASYNRAIALDPSYTAALSNRGHLLGMMGRRAEALESYDRAIAATPGFAPAVKGREALMQDAG